jgi:hypothetical protein
MHCVKDAVRRGAIAGGSYGCCLAFTISGTSQLTVQNSAVIAEVGRCAVDVLFERES